MKPNLPTVVTQPFVVPSNSTSTQIALPNSVFINMVDCNTGSFSCTVVENPKRRRNRKIKETVFSRLKNGFKNMSFEDMDKLNYFFNRNFGIDIEKAIEINRVLNSDFFEILNEIEGE